jgi:hypothetical protein
LLFSLLPEFLTRVICYHWYVPAASNRHFPVIASEAKQSIFAEKKEEWIASSLRSSQ